jgi:tellurite resistance protein TehA-like permease
LTATLLRSRAVAVWVILLGATMCSITLFEASHSERMNHYVSSAVIAVAFVKVRLVGLDFMELRESPAALRLAFELWLTAVGSTLLIMVWLQSA